MKTKKNKNFLKKCFIISLIASLLVPVQNQVFAKDETLVKDGNLREEINHALNMIIEEENAKINVENNPAEVIGEIKDLPGQEKQELRSEKQEITQEDLAKLKVLNAENKGIKDLTGLEHAINLETLNVNGNHIKDLSPLQNIANLGSFSAENQKIEVDSQISKSTEFSLANPIIGFQKEAVTTLTGENVTVNGNEIVFTNLKDGKNEREVRYQIEYEKGNYSGSFIQTITTKLPKEEPQEDKEKVSQEQSEPTKDSSNTASKTEKEDQKEKQESSNGEYRSRNASAKSGDVVIAKGIIGGTFSHTEFQFKYNPGNKRASYTNMWTQTLHGSEVRPAFYFFGESETVTRRGVDTIYFRGDASIRDYSSWINSGEYGWYLTTGTTMQVFREIQANDGNNSRFVRENDAIENLVRYRDPEIYNGEASRNRGYKILPSGYLRYEPSIYNLVSSINMRYLNTTLKVYQNDMVLLQDDSLTKKGTQNNQVMMRVLDNSGNKVFESITRGDRPYYESFEKIQGIKFKDGYKLILTNYSTKEEIVYSYNQSAKRFDILSEGDMPIDKFLIQITNPDNNYGYYFFIENGKIANIYDNGYDKVFHTGWAQHLLIGMGIFNQNGDIKKQVKINGGDHKVLSNSTQIAGLKNYTFNNQDEVVLFATKDATWDESKLVRVLGNVKNAIPNTDKFERKSDWNNYVLRFNASDKTFEMVDGSVANMDTNLKNKVEDFTTNENLLKIDSNGNKKAWLLGLTTRKNAQNQEITFSNASIASYVGLEYSVFIENLNINDNGADPNSYHSLRNMKDLKILRSGGVKPSDGKGTKIVDALLQIPSLTYIYLGYNELTDYTDIARLSDLPRLEQLVLSVNRPKDLSPLISFKNHSTLTNLVLDRSEIIDISFLSQFKDNNVLKTINLSGNKISNAGPAFALAKQGISRTIDISNQVITNSEQRIGTTEIYTEEVNLKNGLNNAIDASRDITSFTPSGKATVQGSAIKWNNLTVGTTELSYQFNSPSTYYSVNTKFSGKVVTPVTVWNSHEYNLEVKATNGDGANGKIQVTIKNNGTIVKEEKVTTTTTFKVYEGQNVTLSVDTEDGSTFTGWDRGISDRSFSFDMPNRDTREVANFMVPTLTVSANNDNGANGDVKVIIDSSEHLVTSGTTSTFKVYEGKTVLLKAEPENGIAFTGWNDGTSEKELTFSMPANDVQKIASFKVMPTLTITANNGDGANGKVNVLVKDNDKIIINEKVTTTNSFKVNEGWTVTLSVDTTDGSTFTGWSDSTSEKERTFTMPANDIQEVASFMVPTLTITANNGDGANGKVNVLVKDNDKIIINEKVTTTNSFKVNEGWTVTLSVDTTDGSTFTGWSDSASEKERTFTMPANDIQEVASFMVPTLTVTAKNVSGANGDVKVLIDNTEHLVTSGTTATFKVYEGQTVTLKTEPQQGSYFKGWSDGTSEKERTFMMPAHNVQEVATFKVTPILTVTAYNGNAIDGDVLVTIGSQEHKVQAGQTATFTVEVGTEVILEAVPSKGTTLLRWNRNNGAEESNSLVLKYRMPDQNMTEVAYFINGYSVTFDPNGGKFSNNAVNAYDSKTVVVQQGQLLDHFISENDVIVTHDSGYTFLGWYDEEGNLIESDFNGWFILIPDDKNTVLTAKWEYNNEAVALIEIPMGIELKQTNKYEASQTATIRIIDGIDQNLEYKNLSVKATPKFKLTNDYTSNSYEVSVWKTDGSKYEDDTEDLMTLHPKGIDHPKEGSFILKTPISSDKYRGKYKGNLTFRFSWK